MIDQETVIKYLKDAIPCGEHPKPYSEWINVRLDVVLESIRLLEIMDAIMKNQYKFKYPNHGEDYWRLTESGGWLYCWLASEEDYSYVNKQKAFNTREELRLAMSK